MLLNTAAHTAWNCFYNRQGERKTASSPFPMKFESDSSAPSPPAPIGFASPLNIPSPRADLKNECVKRWHTANCEDCANIRNFVHVMIIPECLKSTDQDFSWIETYHCALSNSFSFRSTSSTEKCLKSDGVLTQSDYHQQMGYGFIMLHWTSAYVGNCTRDKRGFCISNDFWGCKRSGLWSTLQSPDSGINPPLQTTQKHRWKRWQLEAKAIPVSVAIFWEYKFWRASSSYMDAQVRRRSCNVWWKAFQVALMPAAFFMYLRITSDEMQRIFEVD